MVFPFYGRILFNIALSNRVSADVIGIKAHVVLRYRIQSYPELTATRLYWYYIFGPTSANQTQPVACFAPDRFVASANKTTTRFKAFTIIVRNTRDNIIVSRDNGRSLLFDQGHFDVLPNVDFGETANRTTNVTSWWFCKIGWKNCLKTFVLRIDWIVFLSDAMFYRFEISSF